jgi:hypothetical protein
MTEGPTIEVDQFVAAAPSKVWRLLTEPQLMRLWWAEGDVAPVVGHEFTLDMPGYGKHRARSSRWTHRTASSTPSPRPGRWPGDSKLKALAPESSSHTAASTSATSGWLPP